MSRTMLEQEFFEQFRDQGMDEYSAAEMARDWAIDSGEYDDERLGVSHD
jgi:hypothetical protein